MCEVTAKEYSQKSKSCDIASLPLLFDLPIDRALLFGLKPFNSTLPFGLLRTSPNVVLPFDDSQPFIYASCHD